MFSEDTLQQSRLLIRLLPFVRTEECFALKGGTALNFFWFDLPRLSVDLDLVYLPVSARQKFLTETDHALQRIAERIRQSDPSLNVAFTRAPHSPTFSKLHCRQHDVNVKVEVAMGQRQNVFPTVPGSFKPTAMEMFGPASMPLLSFPETCAGKCHAVLDRQHPRDLFDARNILELTPLTGKMRAAFIVDLLGQGKPIGEMLAPRQQMHGEEAWDSLDRLLPASADRQDLFQALTELKHQLVQHMPLHHRDFLYTFIRGHPDWSLLEDVPFVQHYPAVRWRMQNLALVSPTRRQVLLDKLDLVWPG